MPRRDILRNHSIVTMPGPRIKPEVALSGRRKGGNSFVMLMRTPSLPTGQLRLMATTDLHMHLIPFDYLHEGRDAPSGLVALAPVIARARSESTAHLLCDVGDFLQGSPLADEIAARRIRPHPMIQAFNALNYDAVTLGNHDFEYGLPYLRDVLGDAAAAIVSANLRTGPATHLVRPWAMVTRRMACSDDVDREMRVGIIGFAPPQIPAWSADILQGAIEADDILATARTHLPDMRRAGADLIVALCHGGPEAGPDVSHMENAALHLARIEGIDAVLMGHGHGLFPGPAFDGIAGVDGRRGTLAGKPAVMAGARGQALAVLDLIVQFDATRSCWQIVDHRAALRAAVTPTPRTTALARTLRHSLALPHAATLERLRRPLGATSRALTTFCAALGRDDTAGLLAEVQCRAIRAALRDTPYADLPVLASTAPFHAGGHGGPHHYLDLAAGPLRVRDCVAIVPFDNPVCAVLRRGSQVLQWLERASAYFGVLTPGKTDQPLLNPLMAPYHFDTLHGLRYTIDLSERPEPGSGRIRDVTLNGEPLAAEAPCIVVTNSYRARGGGGLVLADASDIVHTTRRGLRALLMDALRDGIAVPPDAPCPWTFAPLPSTSALFPSSPAARHRLEGLPQVRFSHMQDDGFAAFRCTL